MTSDRIIAHAELAAAYLRALVEKGVTMNAAVQLTQSYVSSYQIAEALTDKPTEQWEEP